MLILSQQGSKQIASSVVTGTTPRKFTFPVQATKTLVVASELGYSNFVCTCLQTQSTMELNQKLTKSMPRRHSIWGVYMREK